MSKARARGASVAMNMEANPTWHVHICYICVLANSNPPLNAIGLAIITEMFITSEIACIVY